MGNQEISTHPCNGRNCSKCHLPTAYIVSMQARASCNTVKLRQALQLQKLPALNIGGALEHLSATSELATKGVALFGADPQHSIRSGRTEESPQGAICVHDTNEGSLPQEISLYSLQGRIVRVPDDANKDVHQDQVHAEANCKQENYNGSTKVGIPLISSRSGEFVQIKFSVQAQRPYDQVRVTNGSSSQ
eukprot:6478859-Amphidinium_carterae.1